jgi:LacI family transcriptional regulator
LSEAPQRTGLVGVLVPLVHDVYFSAILSGAAEAAYEHEIRLVLEPTQHEHAREVSLLDRLMGGLSDGALIVLPEESSAELELALSDRYPFVVVDPLMPLDRRIPSVAAAHRSGADQAMQHLLGLGHRRIAAITGPPGWMATEERRRGYHEALTTVRQPLAEMGRAAIDLLLRLLDGRRPEARRVELPTRLVVRGSTAPPRG